MFAFLKLLFNLCFIPTAGVINFEDCYITSQRSLEHPRKSIIMEFERLSCQLLFGFEGLIFATQIFSLLSLDRVPGQPAQWENTRLVIFVSTRPRSTQLTQGFFRVEFISI